MIDIKEIKKTIKRLKRLKLKCRAGSKERIDLHRQIKQLQDKIIEQNIPEPEQDLLIEKILKIKPEYITLGMNLKKFSIEELHFHFERITKGKYNE